MDEEKYIKVWEKFQNKMVELKRKRRDVLTRISEKMDKQRIEALRKKLENHE